MAQSNMTSSTLGGTTVKLSGFAEISATAFTGPLTGAVTGAATGSHVVTSYLTLGTGDQYLFFGEAQTEASVVAEATTLVGTSKQLHSFLVVLNTQEC